MDKVEVNSENVDSNSEWTEVMADVEEMPVDESEKEDEGSDVEKLLNRAKLYKEFGRVAIALTNLDEALSASQNETITDAGEGEFPTPEVIKAPEDAQADALIKQLESALSDVDRSLENQLDYAIVNHKQINTRDALEHELQSDTSVPELDIRFDKDGKAWISHSPRAGARFFFSKPIHTLHSEEVEAYGERLSLEDGLDIFLKYFEDNPNHKVVLEIKELGASKERAEELLENIRVMLEERGLTDTAIFATLSPAILKAVHDKFPEKSEGPDGDKEFAVKLPNVELFFSNSSEVKERADGYGKQTGYLWTRLPRETVATLRGMNEKGGVGAASLTVVNKFANILEKLSPKTAKKLREHYAAQLDKLGIRKQVAISKSKPAESLLTTKEQMGQDAIIYSDVSPGDFAADLPKIDKKE
jgi:glycerophosphoryl diester phosphodiesterase